MRTERFEFAGSKGQKLSGRLELPATTPRGFAIFAHCFTCSKNSLAAVHISRALAGHGIGVLRFDFTGLGESEGDFGDAGFSMDVDDLVAADTALTGAGFAPSMLIGHSLGGAAALAAAPLLPAVKAVITINAPFRADHMIARLDGVKSPQQQSSAVGTSIELGDRRVTLSSGFIEDMARQDQEKRISSLGRPLLILHAPRDEIVEIANATAIFEAAQHPKSLVSLNAADHMLSAQRDADFVAELISGWAWPYLKHAEPRAATVAKAASTVTTTGWGRLQARVETGGASFLVDEPTSLGGLGTGPNAYDLLCAALGACTAMTLRLYADRKGWDLEKLTVFVDHSTAAGEALPDIFSWAIAIEGELDEAQRTRLKAIASHCPVHRTLERGAQVHAIES